MSKIWVVKYTTQQGVTYYSDGTSPELVKRTLERLPDWAHVERVSMTRDEYLAVPVTEDSARLWDARA